MRWRRSKATSQSKLEDLLLYVLASDSNIGYIAFLDARRASTGRLAPAANAGARRVGVPQGKGRGVYFSIAAQAGGATRAPGGFATLDILSASNYGGGVLWEQFGVGRLSRAHCRRASRPGWICLRCHPPQCAHRVPGRRGDAPDGGWPERRRSAVSAGSRRSASAPSGSASGRNLPAERFLPHGRRSPDGLEGAFVEQPESVAFAAVRGTLWRTILIVLAFVAAAVAPRSARAGCFVRLIKRLQVAAEAIGAGRLRRADRTDRRDELGARNRIQPDGRARAGADHRPGERRGGGAHARWRWRRSTSRTPGQHVARAADVSE